MSTYDRLQNHPDLIAICMACTRDDCHGECIEYTNKYRELCGLPPLQPAKKAKTNQAIRKYTGGSIQKYAAFGREQTMREWAEESGISYHALYQRIKKGMTLEEALETDPERKAPKIEAFGRSMTLRQWAAHTHIDYRTLHKRIQRGMPPEEALTKEVCSGQKHMLTYNGETHCLSEWARRLGCARSTLSEKVNRFEAEGACMDGGNH